MSVSRVADPAARMLWWIVPLAVVAAVAGVALQVLLTFLWTIAKSNLH